MAKRQIGTLIDSEKWILFKECCVLNNTNPGKCLDHLITYYVKNAIYFIERDHKLLIEKLKNI